MRATHEPHTNHTPALVPFVLSLGLGYMAGILTCWSDYAAGFLVCASSWSLTSCGDGRCLWPPARQEKGQASLGELTVGDSATPWGQGKTRKSGRPLEEAPACGGCGAGCRWRSRAVTSDLQGAEKF